MTELEVLLDARGATPGELVRAAGTLLASVPRVQVVHGDVEQLAELARKVGGRAEPFRANADIDRVALRRGVPVLVAPGVAAFARGAVRRVVRELSVPGRDLVCVLVPGEGPATRVACWGSDFLRTYEGKVIDLLDADLDFDRVHLPAQSPVARLWLRADAVGVTRAADVSGDGSWWARTAGLRIGGDAALALLRAPLGRTRRRFSRRLQRRAAAQTSSVLPAQVMRRGRHPRSREAAGRASVRQRRVP